MKIDEIPKFSIKFRFKVVNLNFSSKTGHVEKKLEKGYFHGIIQSFLMPLDEKCRMQLG